jgi:hypothetical protein
LSLGEHLRLAGSDEVEQGVHCGETLIAGVDVVAALVLQVAQKTHD